MKVMTKVMLAHEREEYENFYDNFTLKLLYKNVKLVSVYVNNF